MTVCLVARRPDGAERDEAWEWVRSRWEANTDIPIFVGESDAGPFNRSQGLNRAAADAGSWDVAIVMDADSFCGFDQVAEGVRLAQDAGLHSICFTRFCYLSKRGSKRVMAGFDGSWERFVAPGSGGWTFHGGCSSMLAVPRAAWDAVGGFDEGFASWGWEDVAFSLALQALNPHRYVQSGETIERLRSGFNRLPGDCWHLWHPIADTAHNDHPAAKRNEDRVDLYRQVAHDREGMRSLLTDLGVLT